jgi:hypothetical protein
MLKIAEHGVVLQKMRERLCVRQVVNGHEIYIGVTDCRAEDVATYATETVDANFHCHFLKSS